jgi:hypothetical protein
LGPYVKYKYFENLNLAVIWKNIIGFNENADQAPDKDNLVEKINSINMLNEALQTKEGKKELKKYVEVMPITVTTPAKIKVNTKRVAVSNVEAIEVDEILVIEQQMEDEYKNEYKKLAA